MKTYEELVKEAIAKAHKEAEEKEIFILKWGEHTKQEAFATMIVFLRLQLQNGQRKQLPLKNVEN